MSVEVEIDGECGEYDVCIFRPPMENAFFDGIRLVVLLFVECVVCKLLGPLARCWGL